MRRKNALGSNIFFVVIQTIVCGGILLLAWRVAYSHLGAQIWGMWMIVFSIFSAAKFFDLGFTGATAPLLTRSIANGQHDRALQICCMHVFSVGSILFSVLIVESYILAKFGFLFSFASDLKLIDGLIPCIALTIWLNGVSAVLAGNFDAFSRFDLKALINIISSLVLVGLIYLLIPKYGLVGLCIATLFQSLTLFVLYLWFSMQNLQTTINSDIFKCFKLNLKHSIREGKHYQAVTIFSVCYDPLMKVLIAVFGSVSLVTFYEIAMQIVAQLRNLLTTPFSVLVREFATADQTRSNWKELYTNSCRTILTLSLLTFCSLISFSPLISQIILGNYQQEFVSCFFYLMLGFFVFNTIAIPAYFANNGFSLTEKNMYGHLITAVCGSFLGILFGLWFGGLGVVVGSALGLAMGSMSILVSFQGRFLISFRNLLPPNSPKLLLLVTIAAYVGFQLIIFNTLSTLIVAVVLQIVIAYLCLKDNLSLLYLKRSLLNFYSGQGSNN